MLQYIVQPGDTLSKIAGRILGDATAWEAFYDWNPGLPDDPAQLQVGFVLKYPVVADPGVQAPSYTFQESPKTSIVNVPSKPLTSGVRVPQAAPAVSSGGIGEKIQTLLQDKRVMVAAGVVGAALVASVVLGGKKASA